MASLFWIVTVGSLTWPAAAIPEWTAYWYYRTVHSELIAERRANEAAATEQQAQAVADIRARYDATRQPRTSKKASPETEDERRALLDPELFIAVRLPAYNRDPSTISAEELSDLEKALRYRVAPPESEVLQKFTALESHAISNGEEAGWWACFTLVPPIAAYIIGASLLWAVRGFGRI